jgi:TonB family protein
MKTKLAILLSLLFIISGCAVKKVQDDSQKISPDKTNQQTFVVVEDMPTFKGGDVNYFRDWVQERVKYPESLINEKIEGKVFVMFVVENDGSVTNVEIMKGVHPELDKETIRVVESSPLWKPGLQRGVPVRVRFSIVTEYRLLN